MTPVKTGFGRIRPVGLGVILFAAVMLLLPLRIFTGYGHPLAGAEQFDLCALLGRDPLSALPGVSIEASTAVPGTADHPPGACVLRLQGPEANKQPRELALNVLNRRTMAPGNIRFKTEKYFETFVAEERVSGNAVEAVPGSWKAGVMIERSGAAGRLDFMAEDGGVILWFRSRGLARSDLLVLATASARALRGTGSGNAGPRAVE